MTSTPASSAHAACRSGGIDWGTHSTWVWQGLAVHWRHLPAQGPDPSEASPHGSAPISQRCLVLLHGFGAASGHWRANAGALAAAGWDVYALDLIGFGASAQPGPGRSPWQRLDNRLWARQVQAFLQQVVGGPAVLVGHSLGALVATTCAAFFPSWVQGVVAATLPDPAWIGPGLSPRLRRSPWRRRLQRWSVQLLCRLLPLELLVPLLAHSPLLALGIQLGYGTPVIGDRSLQRLFATPARRPGAPGALRAMSIAMALRPPRATAPILLPRLQHPLVMIWGQRDALVPLAVGHAINRRFAHLPLQVLEGCGHCAHDEDPGAFNALVCSWLAALPAGPAPERPGLDR